MIEYFFRKAKISGSTDDKLYYEYNQWGADCLESNWYVRFLRHHFPQNTKMVNFFGPLGNPFFIRNNFDGCKVFITNEDVEHRFTKLNLYFGDYCLKHVDLALGFGVHKEDKYLRFPYWLTTTFAPEMNEDDIVRRIREINTCIYKKTSDCVLINKHDKKGTREMVYNGVRDILDVKLAGKWKNNTTDLWDKFNNDKEAYLRTFKFNICAENDNTEHYVTEKIFDAFIAGCIPLYYGSKNNPEPGLINKDAVIFWEKDSDNAANRELIRHLKVDENYYNEFISQPKLLPYAEEYVIERFAALKAKFAEILE